MILATLLGFLLVAQRYPVSETVRLFWEDQGRFIRFLTLLGIYAYGYSMAGLV